MHTEYREIEELIVAIISDRNEDDLICEIYHQMSGDTSSLLDSLGKALPEDQVAVLKLAEELKLSSIGAVILIFAALKNKKNCNDWLHFNLSFHFAALLEAGIEAARLPATIHALFAMIGLPNDGATTSSVIRGIISRSISNISPIAAVQMGMPIALETEQYEVIKLMQKYYEGSSLDLNGEIDNSTRGLVKGLEVLLNNVSISDVVGLLTIVVEPARTVEIPSTPALDGGHYMFVDEGRRRGTRAVTKIPSINVYTIPNGIFSIDATQHGFIRHYVFDRYDNCILDLALGSDPFFASEFLEVDEPVAILDDIFSSGMNICHFLLDHVTRIAIYQKIGHIGKFLIADDYPYYRQIFEIMGLADRIIFSKTRRISIKAPKILFSSNIIVQQLRRPAHYCAPWATEFLRRSLNIPERSPKAGRKLMISRGSEASRKIVNWNEVRPMIAARGYEIVELEGLSASQQIDLFSDVERIIGVHGAGLTNLIFAPKDANIFEILPPFFAGSEYWLLASALGQRYSAFVADDPILPNPDPLLWHRDWHYLGRDIKISLEKLSRALDEFDQ